MENVGISIIATILLCAHCAFYIICVCFALGRNDVVVGTIASHLSTLLTVAWWQGGQGARRPCGPWGAFTRGRKKWHFIKIKMGFLHGPTALFGDNQTLKCRLSYLFWRLETEAKPRLSASKKGAITAVTTWYLGVQVRNFFIEGKYFFSFFVFT